MKRKYFLLIVFSLTVLSLSAQNTWKLCHAPGINSRYDDIFFTDAITGYSVCGDGQILKSTDGGNNWSMIFQDPSVYFRSVEFINSQKGFVGAFPLSSSTSDMLLRTDDGGTNWTDISGQLDPKALNGICGLDSPDSNIIYGCGNWFQDTAYIVKSTDGGATWNYIDMVQYASSLIDMHFISADTGFAVGRSPLPLETAIVLYTTDGGLTWVTKFQHTIPNEYIWKLQCLSDSIYFASIEDISNVNCNIIKSTDGGMTWNILPIALTNYRIQGIGFIDSLNGWIGGDQFNKSYKTTDGGLTWDTIGICPRLNRTFKISDSLFFAAGKQIWKYSPLITGIRDVSSENIQFATIYSTPNPADNCVSIRLSLLRTTHATLMLLDANGRRVKMIENTLKIFGDYQYLLNTKSLAEGTYFISLKTHEDNQVLKIIVSHE